MGEEQVEHIGGHFNGWIRTIAISAAVIALLTVLLRLCGL